MSDIKQSFTIDGAQALSMLAQLDAGFKDFSKRIDEVASSMRGVNKVGGLGNQFKSVRQNVADASKEVQRLTTSMSLLSRIVFTQAIVSAFGKLKRSIVDTAESAADFQRALSLIRTISPDQSIGEIGKEVRDLSDSFNIPLLQAAEGVYQSISNQVGDFGQSVQFAAEAAQFAKATNSSLADSVDLLSSAMIGFGKGVEDTSKISGIFFTAIDKGRVTASELSNSFGRINTTAADLGLSLEETAASIASISVRGSKTSESLTQLRSILTGLAKPSVEMQKLLESLGFTSGESAIKVLGFSGVLDEMSKAIASGSTTLGGLLPNVRGMAGAASLTSDGLKSLSENIREMQKAGRDFSKEKFLLATQNDGEKLRAEINKIKNALTVDLGQSVLAAARDLTNLTGGVENFISVVEASGPALLGLAGTLAAIKASSVAGAAGLGEFGKALGLLSLAPAAAGLGTTIGNLIDDKLTENLLRGLKELEKADQESLERFKTIQGEKRDAAQAADDARIKSALQAAREVTKVYNSELGDIRLANDSLLSNTNDALNGIIGSREKLVQELARAAGDGTRIVEQSAQRILGLQDRQGDREFDFKTADLNQAEKVFALAKRSESIAETAAKLLKSTDTRDIERGLQLFEKAQSTGEAAASAAAGSRELEAKSLRNLRELTEQQTNAEENLALVQGRRNEALEQQRDKQQKLTADLKGQAKILLENVGLFDQQGKELSGDALAQRQQKQQAALKRIAELGLSNQDLNATGALGIAKFIQDSQAELTRDPLKLAFDVQQGTADVRAQLDAAFRDFRINVGVDVGALEKLTGQGVKSPDQFVKAMTAAQEQAGKLRAELDQAASQDKRIAQIHDEIGTIFDEIDSREGVRQSVPGELGEQLRTNLESLLQQFTAAGADFKVTEAELKKLIEARNQLGTEALSSTTGKLGFSTTIQALDQLILKFQELSQVKVIDVPKIQAELQGLGAFINQLDPTPAFQSSTTAIEAGAVAADQLANAYERAAAAAQQLATQSPVARMFGGLMHFADGGQARGVDTVPAMLQAGEFVMSKAATQRFYSQIQSMNAGVPPTFRSDGGGVNNTHVGDNVFNIDGTKSPAMTAKAIESIMNRSARRGSTRLR